MGDSAHFVKHIELYVDSSATTAQQAACVKAIATLLKNDMLTLESLVREMDVYLTTTDSFVRSRGVLILAEILAQLTSKTLSRTSLQSLVGFFSERLADWKALQGALVGCLVLLRRKTDVGTVTLTEAKAVALAYIENLQVQSLGQHDRKLSFELMECLLDRHAGAVQDLGEQFVYGICEAIDAEKDPQCLLVVFRIVESLARLDAAPLSDFAEELFEILGCYFPIHLTHPKGEDDDSMREQLSRALMLAFASTPLFEPFSIPMLLDKLSSSLPSAKVESFRYLSYCTTKYEPDRMMKHATSIWASIKDATYISPLSAVPLNSEMMGGMNFQETDVMAHAFLLLQEIILQDCAFISLVMGDDDIYLFVKSLNQYRDIDDVPLLVKQRLHAVGHILSICAKPTVALCNKVFDSFFPLLMDDLGISVSKPSADDYSSSTRFGFGVLYLCIELISACRYLAVSLDTFTDFSRHTCFDMLRRFSGSLGKAFISLLRSNIDNNALSPFVYFGVKGLQILATFPGSFVVVSKSIYDEILVQLMSVVSSESNKEFLWTLALKALVEIGSFIDKSSDSGKAASFEITVVEKVVSLMFSDDSIIPASMILQAGFDIGATRKDFMLRVAEGLDEAIATKISALDDNGIGESHQGTVTLLDTYSEKLIPWFTEIGGFEETLLKFTLQIWDNIENNKFFILGSLEIANDLLAATMNTMTNAVRSCSKETQEIVIRKAFGILCSNGFFGSLELEGNSSILNAKRLNNSRIFSSSCKDGWLASLFASVVIAIRPQTSIPNGKMILTLFITNLLNGHIPSAHALGSLVNKLPLGNSGLDLSMSISLDEALGMISCFFIGSEGTDLSDISLYTSGTKSALINVIIGLAWIGKGLLMRGHEKSNEITMTLLNFLMLDGTSGMSKQLQDLIDEQDKYEVMKCAGDAFHILMSDPISCLRQTHNAIIRPLYKQRFFSTIMPIILPLVVKSDSSFNRSMLYRAFAYVVCETPMTAVLGEAKKLLPVLLDCLCRLSKDVKNKEIVYDVLLIISGILVDKTGQEAALENATSIVNQLIQLTSYSHLMAVRETALLCLVAISALPHTRIYPLRAQVLGAISKALDDPKRIVRQEAVRCRQSWASIG